MPEDKKSEENKKQGAGNVSRRDFLKDAGFVVGAPAIGSIALSSEQASAQSKDPAVQSEADSTVCTIEVKETATEKYNATIHSIVKYDLLGKIAENTQLTRKTIAEILTGVNTAVFKQFRQNPEHFISEASRIINEQKATIIIEQQGIIS